MGVGRVACEDAGNRNQIPLWGCWGLRGERLSVSKEPPPPAPFHPQVRSPLSDSILGEQALAVTDDKVSVLELRVQPVMGISLALSRGTAHQGEVTATCWAQSALPTPKQVTAGDQGDEANISRWGPIQGGGVVPQPLTLGFSE